MFIAVMLLLSGAVDDTPYLREPISAACVREVAEATGEVGNLLGEPELRDAARVKARQLSTAVGQLARANQTSHDTYIALYRKTKDEYDSGIASRSELDEIIALKPVGLVDDIEKLLREYPSCYLLAHFPDNEISRMAKDRVGQ